MKDYWQKLESDPEFQQAAGERKLHFALANAVLRARLSRGWSQAELAAAVGTKQANISRIEAGLGNPTLDLVSRLVQILDLGVYFLENGKIAVSTMPLLSQQK